MPTWTKEVVDLSVAGTSLTIDDIKIDGNTIGHTNDTDLLTLTNTNLTVAGNVTIENDLTVTGNTITFGNGEIINNASDNIISFATGTLLLTTTGSSATLQLKPGTNGDAKINLFERPVGGICSWTIGNDGASSDVLKFDAGVAVVGDATKLSLTQAGNMTIAGDLTISGGNITNAITCDSDLTVTGTMYAARILYHTGDTNTYLDFRDDRISLYAGGNTVLDYAEDGSDTLKLAGSGNADTTIGDATTFFVGGSEGSYDTKVGIGTATPSSALDVVGLVTASLGVKLGNNIIYASDGAATITINPTNDDITILGGLTAGSIGTGRDVKFWGASGSNYMLWDASQDVLHINTTDDEECLKLTSTDTGAVQGPAIIFERNPGEVGEVSDNLGACIFKGYNANPSPEVITYGEIATSITSPADSKESGKMELKVDANGTVSTFLSGTGAVDGTVDVSIAVGTDSITTIAGTSQLNGTLTVGADTDGHDVKFFGNTTANYMLWDESQDILNVIGSGVNIKQLGGNDYQPRLNFYNYDAGNSSSQGMSEIHFFNSKSDTEAYVATDADAHLGRLVWHASTDSDFKYASTINCRQTSAYGSGANVGSELKFTTQTQIDTGATVASSFSWAPPATPAADNKANLIINGTSVDITQASANQLYIKNGEAPGTVMDTYIAIGSKNIGGDTALELTQEEAPVEEAVTSDWTLQVTINGKIYKILLEYVSG
jgi:hypothetical protein